MYFYVDNLCASLITLCTVIDTTNLSSNIYLHFMSNYVSHLQIIISNEFNYHCVNSCCGDKQVILELVSGNCNVQRSLCNQ